MADMCRYCQLDTAGQHEYNCPLNKNKYFTINTQPFICPVCSGKGFVQPGFYSYGSVPNNLYYDTCKTCNGRGIVWRE